MVNEYTAPIDHSTGSAVGTTAAGAAGGALKGGVKTGLGWMGIAIGIGALTGLGLFLGGAGFLLSGGLWSVLGGAAAGGVLGSLILGPVTAVGAILGGAKGGARAAHKVSEERGAAAAVQAQIDMVRAQAQPQASAGVSVYAPSATNSTSFPMQGTPMNPASPRIMAGNDNLQYQGALADKQLAQSM